MTDEADPIMQEMALFRIKLGASKSIRARQAESRVGHGRSEAKVVNPKEKDETREQWDRKVDKGKPGQHGRQGRSGKLGRHDSRIQGCRQGRRVRQKTEKCSVSVIGMATILRNPWSLCWV